MARVAITSAPGGGVAVELPTELRELLVNVARQMREVLTEDEYADSPALARLLPTAVPDDPMESLGFEQLMGQAIRDGKVEAATILEATAFQERLTDEETLAWLRCLNDVRLMLGTHLNVSEDVDIETFMRDPATEHAAVVYIALSELVEMMVRAVDPA
jgi:leucyl aminopeptidase (aminopeptidase T)